MSGTSMDAIDAALVEIANDQIRLIGYRQYPITSDLRRELITATRSSSIDYITRLDVRMGRLFAEAAIALMRENSRGKYEISAIGCHGQTILHRPEPPEPTTLQIGDPNIIAHITGITTVADFRRMDIAAGGQGAPLTPALHNHIFRHETKNRVVVNIGGIANITTLPAKNTNSTICGFDTGPGNVLLDEWVFKHTGQSMDVNGNWSARGTCNPKLLELLIQDDYFDLAPPKSTGRDYFNIYWLLKRLDNFDHPGQPEDIQSTLVQLTAVTITNAINKYAPSTKEVIVGGGGAHNPQLMQALSRNLAKCNVLSTRDIGINPDALEAMAFAWLAKRRIEGHPGNLPAVTGATTSVVLGCIYEPGTGDCKPNP